VATDLAESSSFFALALFSLLAQPASAAAIIKATITRMVMNSPSLAEL
jgi:hypothetical protein